MTVGSNFGIRGIVETSCGTITNVQAYILDSNYNAIQTSEYTPNESALDLRYSINNDLVFGRLPAGSYVYYVEATAVNGDKTTNETLINVSFNVIAPTPEPQPEPSIQMVGYDMVVNVSPVGMSGYDEGMPAFGKCQGQLIADTVCFLGGDLSGFEGLPDLIGCSLHLNLHLFHSRICLGIDLLQSLTQTTFLILQGRESATEITCSSAEIITVNHRGLI